MGKVALERLFTDAAEAHGGWDCIRVCPADNVGPSYLPTKKTWGHGSTILK